MTKLCEKQLLDFYKKIISELAVVKCVLIVAREQPPRLIVGASSEYVLLGPYKRSTLCWRGTRLLFIFYTASIMLKEVIYI